MVEIRLLSTSRMLECSPRRLSVCVAQSFQQSIAYNPEHRPTLGHLVVRSRRDSSSRAPFPCWVTYFLERNKEPKRNWLWLEVRLARQDFAQSGHLESLRAALTNNGRRRPIETFGAGDVKGKRLRRQ